MRLPTFLHFCHPVRTRSLCFARVLLAFFLFQRIKYSFALYLPPSLLLRRQGPEREQIRIVKVTDPVRVAAGSFGMYGLRDVDDGQAVLVDELVCVRGVTSIPSFPENH